MYKDLKYLIGGSSVAILTLVGFMFFSPLSSQFTDDSISRGSSWVIDVDELINHNQEELAPSVRICNADVLSISICNALTSINSIELAQAGT